MPYATVANVRSIVDTDITDAEITDIILWVEEIIKIKIDVTAFSATFLTGLSALYAAYRCMLKDANARSLGEYSERREEALNLIKEELDDLLGTAGGTVGAGGVAVVATMEPV